MFFIPNCIKTYGIWTLYPDNMNEVNIQVAVRIRPLLPQELLRHHSECVKVVPGSAQVIVNPDRLFTFDYAFSPSASQEEVYRSCIQPMVRSLMDGYNATVFCYGETGSGKTYTVSGGGQGEFYSTGTFDRKWCNCDFLFLIRFS